MPRVANKVFSLEELETKAIRLRDLIANAKEAMQFNEIKLSRIERRIEKAKKPATKPAPTSKK